ncbi:MAG: glycoside hydrolase family 3 protein [Bacteroidota bacterium]
MSKPDFLSYLEHTWVQEKISSLSLKQQIGQLIHIPAWSQRGPEHVAEVLQLVQEHGVGGICFFQGDTERQAMQTQLYQQASNLPLMISQDAEWGLAMRLSDCERFPYAMTLGASRDIAMIEEVGRHIGRECRELGVHVNYAPVVDVNTHPDNPVIGFRSFGAKPEEVTIYAGAFAAGMMTEGVMPVIKHFPGHGDTALDSHLDLPTLLHDETRLNEVELYPFRKLIRKGLPAVMSSHIHIPVWDDVPHRAATHSSAIIQGQLRQKLQFEGLLFTDALDMQGVRKYTSAAEVNLRALLAGQDVLLFCVDVPGTIEKVLQAVEEGMITEEVIRQHCQRNLAAKYFYTQLPAVSTPLNMSREAVSLAISRQALQWVKGEEESWPTPGETAWIFLDVSEGQENDLQHHQLSSRGRVTQKDLLGSTLEGRMPIFHLSAKDSASDWLEHRACVASFDQLIVWIEGIGLKARQRFGISEEVSARLMDWAADQNIHFIVPASPYAVPYLGISTNAQRILLTYQDHPAIRECIAQEIEAHFPSA